MSDLAAADRWLESHLEASLAELSRLVAQPSIAAPGVGMQECAALVAGVRAHKDRLAAQACVWEFSYVDSRGVPLQYAGLRGICYVELSVATAAIDVHSGVGGSIFPNAAWRLVWALATLKGLDERIRIPH